MSWHKQQWLTALGLLGGAAAIPGVLPAVGGLFGGLGAGGAGEAASAGILGSLGSMGPEQAGILAAQNAGLGFGADASTLDAAATAGGTPWGAMSDLANNKGVKFGMRLSALGQQPQPQAQPMAPPRSMQNAQAQQQMDAQVRALAAQTGQNPEMIRQRLMGFSQLPFVG